MDRQTISSSVPAPLSKPGDSSSPGAPSKTHRKIFESVRTKRRPCCARPRKSGQHPCQQCRWCAMRGREGERTWPG